MWDWLRGGRVRKLEGEVSALRETLQNVGPWTTADSGAMADIFGLTPAASGAAVTPQTARRSTAVYACVNLYVSSIAATPIAVYERSPNGARSKVTGHDYWWLLNESPHPNMTSAAWWDMCIGNLLLHGDGLVEMRRKGANSTGAVDALVPHARDCSVIYEAEDGYVGYGVDNGKRRRNVYRGDVLHFPGRGFNGLHGESVIRFAARQAVGTALAADEFSGAFFARGATPSVAIQYPAGVAPKREQQDDLRKQFDERYVGRENSHRPMLLVNGGTVSNVSLSPEDGQLLETRQWQVVDIARAFGVPPILIGEGDKTSSWGSGVEQVRLAFLTVSLNSLLIQLEQEFNRKFWPRSQKYFVEFQREGWLEGDAKTQAEVLKAALGGPGQQGYMSVNEARRIKNMPPDSDTAFDSVVKSGGKVPQQERPA